MRLSDYVTAFNAVGEQLQQDQEELRRLTSDFAPGEPASKEFAEEMEGVMLSAATGLSEIVVPQELRTSHDSLVAAIRTNGDVWSRYAASLPESASREEMLDAGAKVAVESEDAANRFTIACQELKNRLDGHTLNMSC
jgi:hypothetical protein